MGGERREWIIQLTTKTNPQGEELMDSTKPFSISKQAVWNAYQQVQANHGAAGVDGESIEAFETRLKDNLYKLWNRLASGSYFPPPVKVVAIAKKEGGQRLLGVPTVADRIAQTVVKQALEPLVEPQFHRDSYGYRPGKSAHQALETTRQRCWRYAWVVKFDIKGAFDNLSHELMMKAVRHHTECKWILLYCERWLTAPGQYDDGRQEVRTKGTAQGGVVSPLLMNLVLHYVFDHWMQRHYPQHPFERYADDGLAHCQTEAQALALKAALVERFAACGLELHPTKTRIIYCKDDDRPGEYEHTTFDFLGYTFRARRSKNRWGKYFVNFTPAVSNAAGKAMRQKTRSWGLQERSDKSLEDLSRMFNPILRGWINYYGRFYRSAMTPTLRHVDRVLVRWAMRKYKRLRRHKRRAEHWLGRIARKEPQLFAHWQMGVQPTAG
jgi:RNA-directed DNA polymerase